MAAWASQLIILTANDLLDDEPQALFAFTYTVPVALLQFTVIEFVPCPLVITQPVGTIQV
jgi:hypothetical protein